MAMPPRGGVTTASASRAMVSLPSASRIPGNRYDFVRPVPDGGVDDGNGLFFRGGFTLEYYSLAF